MKISYDKERLEIYGTQISNNIFKRIKRMLFPFKFIKKSYINIDKENKSFIISCGSIENFNHMYESITYSFQEAKNKGLMPNLEIQEFKKQELSNSDKSKISKGFDIIKDRRS